MRPDRSGYSARQAVGAGLALVFTVAGIIWLAPITTGWVILFSLLSVLVPVAALPLLNERDLRARNHIGALSRFYLDALNGLVAIRSHGCEAALEQEHESLTTEWGRSEYQLLNVSVAVEGLQTTIGVIGLHCCRHYMASAYCDWLGDPVQLTQCPCARRCFTSIK